MMETVMRAFGGGVETLVSSLTLVTADPKKERGPFCGRRIRSEPDAGFIA